jgi:hypothetical protein
MNMNVCISLMLSLSFFIGSRSAVYSQGKESGRLMLKSGFEEGVSVTSDMATLTGSDVPGYSWDEKQAWISFTEFTYIVNPDKNLEDYMESVIEEATGPHGNCL